MPAAAPGRILSGFYLNELLLRLLPGEEAQPEIFGAYSAALEALASEGAEQEALRLFEKMLLEQLGYGLDLGHETGGGEPLTAEGYYHFRPGHGHVRGSRGGARQRHTAALTCWRWRSGRLETPASLRSRPATAARGAGRLPRGARPAEPRRDAGAARREETER
jgi:recombinational DNA repair protein (RecF pathway)